MTINIPFQVSSTGSAQAVQDFEAIRKAIQQTAKESAGITSLAAALGTSYREAKQLSQSLSLTAEETVQAVAALKQLRSVGADNATQFQVLQGKMGLTVGQFEAISAAISGQKQSIAQVVAGYSSLAKSIGSSYEEAEAFAKELGLTASQAQQAVAQLRDLNSVGASTALRYQVLEDSLQITVEQFDKLEAAARGAKDELEDSGKSAGGFNNVLAGVGQGIGQAGFGALTNVLSGLPGQIAGPTLQFEKFRTVLNTLYGDAAKADEAFNQIQQFAATTPFQLDEVLGSFIALKNRGLDPTQELLRNMGDIASSQGKSLNQFTEAILDATSGEFERLKEFGVQASQSGDKVRFTFKGVTKEVEKTPEAIQGAIQSFGQMQGVAGGMEAQSKTLGGALSNLSDNATKIAVAFGEELIPVLVEFVNGAMGSTASMEEFARSAGQNVAQVLKVVASSLKFVNDNAAIFQSLLAVVIAQMAAMKAIGLYQALLQLAAGMTGAAAGTAGFSTILTAASISMKAFLASALALAPALAALGIAVGAIAFTKLIADLKAANEELDAMAETATMSMNEFGQVAGKVKSFNTAFEKNGSLSAEQQRQAKGYIQISKEKIKAIDEEIARAKAISPANDDQRRSQEALVSGLEAQRQALTNQTTELEKNLKTIKDRTRGVENAEDAEKALKKIVEGIKLGTTSEGDALKQLEAIKNNSKAGLEARKEASDQILDIRKNQIDGEIALLDAGKTEIESKVRSGVLSEAAAQEQLTAIARDGIQKRLQLNREQQASASGSEKDKLIAEERQLQSELADIQSETAAQENDRAIESFNQRKSILEGQYAQGKVSKANYNKQLLDLDLAQNDEELRQLREQLSKLEATDTEGREAINAKIGEVTAKRADITRAAYQRELEAVEEANDKALDAVKLAETQRSIEIAKLEKSKAVSSEQAEQLRSKATISRIDAEIAAERDKYNKISSLKAANPDDEAKRQDDMRGSQQRLADLTLQRVDQEMAAEKALQEAAKKALEEQIALRAVKTRQAVLGIQKEISALDRQQKAQEAIVRSLDRQQKLSQSSFDLVKAQSDAEVSRYDVQLAGLNQAIGLVKQYNQEADPTKKYQQGRILGALGVSSQTAEIDLIRKKQAIEDQQAAAKKQQLAAEQAQAKVQLEINIKKSMMEAKIQLLTAKKFEYEAKITAEKTKQAVEDAKAELALAKQGGDQKEIAEAKAALEEAKAADADAREGLKFATDFRKEAEQNVKDQPQLAEQQRQALDAQQAAQVNNQQAQEGARLLGQTMELAATGTQGFSAALQKASEAAEAFGGSLARPVAARRLGGSVEAGRPYLVGEEGPELIAPRRNGWVFTARQTAKLLADVQPSSPFALPTGTVSQIVSFRRDAAMLEELKQLRSQVERMRPVQEKNTFNLNSNQLVADAADLHVRISKNRLRRSRNS